MPGEGLANAVGAGVPIRFDGRDLILDPLQIEDFGVLENDMRSKLPNVLKLVAECRDVLPPEVFDQKWNEALAEAKKIHAIPAEDVIEYAKTDMHGIALTFSLSLTRRYGEEFTIKRCYEILQTMAEQSKAEFDELLRKRDMVSGLSEEGNSTGPTPSSEETPGLTPTMKSESVTA